MRTRLTLVSIFCLFCSQLSAQPLAISLEGVDLSCTQSHPRLLMSDSDFKQHRKVVNACRNSALLKMHSTYMDYADECVAKDKEIVYEENTSGKLLAVSREVLGEVGACSYAYRFTKDPKYAERVESILEYVCGFETWNPKHYLDVAEMSLAVALGYDWCYARLSADTKAKCELAVREYSFDTAEAIWPKKFRNGTNRGQVLNAGLICSAIAFYDNDPERSKRLIARAVKDNADYIAYNYAPDGICPEGPGYWGYGTSAQVIINGALEHTYGTDFGLSECPGFEQSAEFVTFCTGSSGDVFNFSDGAIKPSQPALWYFADKFSRPSLAYNEVRFIEKNPNYRMRLRFGFIYLQYAAKVVGNTDSEPDQLLFSGHGKNPLMMARNGWTNDALYVGAKGGGAKNSHSHLDAGSFVFDAYGYRWLSDISPAKYNKTESALKSIGASLWTMDQASKRWKIYGYNNRQHNTLTINNSDHLVTGKGELEQVWNESSRRGARFGLTSLFEGQADSVSRTICIVNENHLEIVDYVRALPDKSAEVYSNFTTRADVFAGADCIVLSLGKTQMEIKAEGAVVEYVGDLFYPDDIPEVLDVFYNTKKEKFAGISYIVPPGETIVLKTTIKRIGE